MSNVPSGKEAERVKTTISYNGERLMTTVGERDWEKSWKGEWFFTIGMMKRESKHEFEVEFYPTNKEGVKAVNTYMKLNPPKPKQTHLPPSLRGVNVKEIIDKINEEERLKEAKQK